MATNIEQNKHVCPICVGNYKEARKLPGCSHSFCQNCILQYVTNLKKDAKLGPTFDCPVCRTPTAAPENDITIEWVKSFESDHEARSEPKPDSGDMSDTCSQCKYMDKAKIAKFYCVNCRECFCEACCELLHSFKQNRTHVLLPVEDSSKSFHCEAVKMLRNILTCSRHNNAPIEQWCQDDDALCCVYCVTSSHRLCSSVRKVADLPEKKVLQTNSKDMLNMCRKVSDHLQIVVDIIKSDSTTVKRTADTLRTSFQDMKQRVIRLLDAAEENINQQCKTLTKEITIKNEDETDVVRNIVRKSSIITYLLQNIFDKLSPECRIICTQDITNMLFDLERLIVERGCTRSSENIMLNSECLLDEILSLGPNETTKLVSVERVHEEVDLPGFKETYSVTLDTITSAGFWKINASFNTYPAFMSMAFLSNDYLLLNDTFNGICCLVDDRNEIVGSHNFNVKAVKRGDMVHTNFIHATPVRPGLIAVSVPLMYKICFITADADMKITCELTLDKTPHAIHGLRNNEIAVMWSDPPAFGIIKVDAGSYKENVYLTQDKSGRVLKSSLRMAIDEGRKHVVQPCIIDNAVYCFDFEGNPVFKYTHDELSCPAGVAVDKQGEVYVCERMRSIIHVLSPTGNLLQLFQRECPESPFAVAFSRRGDRFAVSTLSNFDRVYFFSLGMEGDEELGAYEGACSDDEGEFSDDYDNGYDYDEYDDENDEDDDIEEEDCAGEDDDNNDGDDDDHVDEDEEHGSDDENGGDSDNGKDDVEDDQDAESQC